MFYNGLAAYFKVRIHNRIKSHREVLSTSESLDQMVEMALNSASLQAVRGKDIRELMQETKPGSPEDAISLLLLHKCALSFTPYVTKMINLSLSTGTIPLDRKKGVVTSLSKKWNLDSPKREKVRAITLLQAMNKIKEIAVCKQLTKWLK